MVHELPRFSTRMRRTGQTQRGGHRRREGSISISPMLRQFLSQHATVSLRVEEESTITLEGIGHSPSTSNDTDSSLTESDDSTTSESHTVVMETHEEVHVFVSSGYGSRKSPRRTSRKEASTAVKQRSHTPKAALIPRPTASHSLCVVLDLDETLVSCRSGTLLVRPLVSRLLCTLHNSNCEVVLWTASLADHCQNVAKSLTTGKDVVDGALVAPQPFHHVIARDSRWFVDGHPCVKDLRRLGRDLRRTLIVENSPLAVQMHPQSAILVQDYTQEDCFDGTLGIVAEILERCAQSSDSVEDCLARDSCVQRSRIPISSQLSVSHRSRVLDCWTLRYTTRRGPRHYGGLIIA